MRRHLAASCNKERENPHISDPNTLAVVHGSVSAHCVFSVTTKTVLFVGLNFLIVFMNTLLAIVTKLKRFSPVVSSLDISEISNPGAYTNASMFSISNKHLLSWASISSTFEQST